MFQFLCVMYFSTCILGIFPAAGITEYYHDKYKFINGTLVTIFIVCLLLSPITFCVLMYKGIKHCAKSIYGDWDKLFPRKSSDEILMSPNGDDVDKFEAYVIQQLKDGKTIQQINKSIKRGVV